MAAARKRALFDPLQATEFRYQAREKIQPAVTFAQLTPETRALLETYLGLRDPDAPVLPRNTELARLPCLDKPHQHLAFCEKLIWALCDPEARRWVNPAFYQTS